MNRGVKGFLHHGGCAGELDDGASFADPRDLKTVRCKPGSDRLYVGVGGAELLAKLFGRKPLVVVRRRLVLLLVEQTQQGGVLLAAALQNEQHPLHGQGRQSCPPVVVRERERRSIPAQERQGRFIDSLRDAWLHRRLLGNAAKGKR